MRKFKVSSRSKIGIFYRVEADDGGEIRCNCPAGERDSGCNHKDLIRDFLDRKVLSSKELSRIKEI